MLVFVCGTDLTHFSNKQFRGHSAKGQSDALVRGARQVSRHRDVLKLKISVGRRLRRRAMRIKY